MARPRTLTTTTPAPAADELRDLLLVVRRALLLVDTWWQNYPREQFPASHPYRMALRMVVGYIERRYLIG